VKALIQKVWDQIIEGSDDIFGRKILSPWRNKFVALIVRIIFVFLVLEGDPRRADPTRKVASLLLSFWKAAHYSEGCFRSPRLVGLRSQWLPMV
jgi:hypothetical protein